MIDPREFLADYRPCPAHIEGIGAELWGDAPFHWRQWYRRKRLERRNVFERPIIGEIGRIEGIRFLTA